jgi:hypothetical protein
LLVISDGTLTGNDLSSETRTGRTPSGFDYSLDLDAFAGSGEQLFSLKRAIKLNTRWWFSGEMFAATETVDATSEE